MKAKDVLRILNITHKTLGNYVKNGRLNPVRINSNHYEYDAEEVYAILGKNKERYNVSYSRVSNRRYKDELKIQTQKLYDFAISNGFQLKEQIEDIKSGLKFSDRKGFVTLLKKVINYEVKNVFVENEDRLTRFGFSLIKLLFEQYGTKIVVLSEEMNRTYEQELMDDLLHVIEYYSMKPISDKKKLNDAAKALKQDE